jgi:hypothetical protein
MWLVSVLGLSKRFEALKIQRAEKAKTEAAAEYLYLSSKTKTA